MKTKRLRKFFALLLSVSMIMSTLNLTVWANALKSSGSTSDLSEMVYRSAQVLEDGSVEVAVTVDTDGAELMAASGSDAGGKECTCEVATYSNCKATDSNCKMNGCVCCDDGLKNESAGKHKYNDVKITEITSKWDNLDTKSIKVWDGNSVIYEYDSEKGEYAWVDDEAALTSGKPVTLRVVDPKNYDKDDEAVYGNENGDIYRIIWNVKDGALTEDECYTLTYVVETDIDEPGFSFDEEYPMTGVSKISYVNAKGKTVEMVLSELSAPMAAVSMFSLFNRDAEAVGDLASKESELVTRRDNRYKITLNVPGADAPEVHDEVIVMVDGSYSGDDEWPSTRKAILEIGEAVLNGVGNTQLTLMTFGMGDNIVVEKIKSVEELDDQLTELPGGLLYGRSSTNCEAGFTGIQEYIEENEDLNSAYVIYITDGEINTDETPEVFDDVVNTPWNKTFSLAGSIMGALEEQIVSIEYGLSRSDSFVKAFETDVDLTTLKSEINNAVTARHSRYQIPTGVNTETEVYEKALNWIKYTYEDVYEYSGLTCGESYPVSVVERAFVAYDEANNTYVQEAFYYPLMGRSYPDRWTRTPAAANALAAMDEVAHLYMVDTNGATSWMNPKNSDDSKKNVVGENVTFTYNAYTNGLTESLSSALSEIAKTQYNDVVITDYMSKWVNLDQTTIQIIDESTGEAIYSSKDGWLVDEDARPTKEDVPVVIELVDAEDYEDGGSAVVGNESGDIYKLTWYVKDGGLLRSDNYHLEYEVTVDTAETGFVYGKDYPANGDTTVTYTDNEDEPQEEDIDVPSVETIVGHDPTGGTKVDKLLDRSSNLYEVKVSVPGADTEAYDEMILMIDASSSQFKNIDELKQTLVNIGENVLNENGTMHLTLMHFGIGATTPYSGDMYSIFTANTMADLMEKLETVDYSVLERWPTGTNCEGSFTHLQEYIENSENLKDAYIIYTSDGETNMSDEPRIWTDWRSHTEWHYQSMGAAKIVAKTISDEYNNIKNGAGISAPTKELFKDEVAAYGSDLSGLAEAVKAALTSDSAKADQWINLAWQMAYENAGFDLDGSYGVSKVEGAFIKAHGMEGTWHYHFAYTCLGTGTYEDLHGSYRGYTKGQRAAAACNELAAMDQVAEIYLLGMDGNGGDSCLTSWMNPTTENIKNQTAKVFADHEKITFIDCTKDTSASALMAELRYLADQISLMPMNDVTVVDYMSKWVNLDLNSIKILDGDEVIYAYNATSGQYEWLISEEDRPTTKTPIIVELVDAADYADGGSDVVGNTSGDIYRITWNIKDGALRVSDNYHMTYRVTVDTYEAGYEYDKDYPANGNTTVEYTDENGERNIDPIDVPDVNAEEPDPATATKTDELIDRDTNKYKVTISVPGADGEKIHDEVILMVDGSYSLDEEWPAMKEAITGMAESLLNGNGNTQLTLMAFGMGDNIVAEHVKSAGEIAALLGELPGTLLYGRSSTNCEAGLTGVGEYIDAHDESLNEVYVIYITDGNINTDETPVVFDDVVNTPWNKTFSLAGSIMGALEEQIGSIEYGFKKSDSFVNAFGADVDLPTLKSEINNAVTARHSRYQIPTGVNTETEVYEKALNWVKYTYEDVYEYSGLTCGESYPVSVVERAFVAYDEANNTYVQEAFYYPLMGRSYPDRWTRTPAAANALAAKEEVNGLYFVDYSGYTAWMDTGVTAYNSEYVQADGIDNILTAMEDMITDLALMPYQDVVITDYMSKWVNLDTTTIKVIDDKTGTEIYNTVDGWLITENRPTTREVPVVVEKVDPADYAAGGNDVIGNTNGDIYKLTWYVKDEALLRSDSYHLEYEVTVDTEEEGFSYEVAYPANGNTNMEYTDENGIDHDDPIEVPDVDVPETETDPEIPGESQPSESQPTETQPSNSERDDDEPDRVSSRVLGASDEKSTEAETEGFTGAVLGAFDTFEILDDLVPLGVLPATGDVSLIWMALGVLSALGLAGTSMIERKKRK